MNDFYFRNADGFIVLYDITKRSTFESVENRIKSIIQLRRRNNTPFVIVANKLDLEENRQVTEEGKNLSKKFKNCSFFQSSSKTRVNNFEIFMCLFEKCIQCYPFIEQDKKNLKIKSKCLLN